MSTYTFSKQEEKAHAITHGIGLILSCIGFICLLTMTINADIWKLISALIFGTTMIFMYMSSTIAHSLPKGKWKDIFQICDHISIYLLIAGTYTPFLLVHLRGEIGWLLLTIIWGIALIGVVFKVFFVKRFLVLSTLFYVLMGWLIVFVWKPLTDVMHSHGITLLVLGGLIYTIGTIFYICRLIPYHHVIWHLFVILGSVFHYLTITLYVI